MNDRFFYVIQVIAVSTVIAILAGIAMIMWPKSQHISYADVRQNILINSDNITSNLVLPSSIKTWNGQSLKVLNGWLKGLSEKEAQYFLNNLHDIIDEAQQDPSVDLNIAVNTYKQMYLTKLSEYQSGSLKRTFQLIFVMIGILVIILICVLVGMISIVRNVKIITNAVLDIDQIGTSIHDSAVSANEG